MEGLKKFKVAGKQTVAYTGRKGSMLVISMATCFPLLKLKELISVRVILII